MARLPEPALQHSRYDTWADRQADRSPTWAPGLLVYRPRLASARVRRTLGCVQTFARLSARNWGRNERCRAPDLRICRVLLALWGLAPWGNQVIADRTIPGFPRNPSVCHIQIAILNLLGRYSTVQVLHPSPRPRPRVHRTCQLARDVEPGRPIRARTGEPRPLEQRVGHHYHTTLFALRTLTTTRLSMGCRVRNHTMEGSGSDMHRH